MRYPVFKIFAVFAEDFLSKGTDKDEAQLWPCGFFERRRSYLVCYRFTILRIFPETLSKRCETFLL